MRKFRQMTTLALAVVGALAILSIVAWALGSIFLAATDDPEGQLGL